MNRIEQFYIINAPPEVVWQALTEPETISQWSGAPATFTAEPGEEYTLWDENVRGRVIEVVPLERLVQTWKPTNWNEENSVVTLTLTPSDGGTRVDLVHENVQDWDYDATTHGWDIYYLGAIKHMLETRPAEEEIGAPAQETATKKAAVKKTAATKKKAAAKKAAAKKRAGKKAAKKATAKKSATKKRAAKRK